MPTGYHGCHGQRHQNQISILLVPQWFYVNVNLKLPELGADASLMLTANSRCGPDDQVFSFSASPAASAGNNVRAPPGSIFTFPDGLLCSRGSLKPVLHAKVAARSTDGLQFRCLSRFRSADLFEVYNKRSRGDVTAPGQIFDLRLFGHETHVCVN